MALIHILRADGTEDDVDESLLQRYEVMREDDQQTVRTVEYCLLNCEGPAHQRQIADCPAHFCDRHVHRSGSVVIKQWPVRLGAVLGEFR
jgi:hypothetical protein